MKKNELILEMPFLMVYLNSESNVFEIFWQKKESEMSNEEFKNHLETFSQLFEKYQVKGFFVDARAYHMVMTIEIQTWHDEVIIPRYITGGVKKIAFVMTQEFMPALSIEQAFAEPQAKQLEVNYFEEENQAKKWLFS